MSQLDFILRRNFHLQERPNLQFRADFFNIFNRPNLAAPDRFLDDGNLFDSNTFYD